MPWPIVACPKPVVAAVDGPRWGWAPSSATQCDVRVASTRAASAGSSCSVASSPTPAPARSCCRLVGPAAAMRLLFSGEIIGAAEALRLGLVTMVVEPDELPAAADAEARRYLDASPFALRRTKELVYGGMVRPVDEHLRETARLLEESPRDHLARGGRLPGASPARVHRSVSSARIASSPPEVGLEPSAALAEAKPYSRQ